jgi:hypothetical protein
MSRDGTRKRKRRLLLSFALMVVKRSALIARYYCQGERRPAPAVTHEPQIIENKKSKKKHDDVIVSRSPEEFAVYITNMNRFCNTLSTVGRKRKENPRWVGWEVPGSLFGGFRDGSHPAARR